MYNDFLLIRKMKQGDDNTFEVVCPEVLSRNFKLLLSSLFDQTYAEDFTQETFIRFFKLPDYHYKGKH